MAPGGAGGGAHRWWGGLVVALALAGFGLRLSDFGRYGFWNDEAWVALCTRVQGLEQFWLSLSVTPVLWAATLRALPDAQPEITLRLLPLAFGCLTLWAAWRAGTSFAGSQVGGVFALALVAVDRLSITYSQLLKHYSAETFFALLAFWCADRFHRSRRGRDLCVLAIILIVGLGFSNAQLLVAPPLLAALLIAAVVRRDWRMVRIVSLAGLAVGLWDAAWFRLLIAPHLLPSVIGYWEGTYVPSTSIGAALRFVGASLAAQLAQTWSAAAIVAALFCLIAVAVGSWERRTIALALLFLIAELAVLSALRRLPFDEPRVMLFLLTTLGVYGVAAVAAVGVELWRRRMLRPLVALGGCLLVYDLAAHRLWRAPGSPPLVEDVGPLIRVVEEHRAPEDHVLLYGRSTYVYAYYQTATPLVVPEPATTVGFRPLFTDPHLTVVGPTDLAAALDAAFAKSPQVWFIGSRFHPGDEYRMLAVLMARGTLVVATRRPNAVLLALRR